MVELDIAKIAYCKIYPPIGIARVGDSQDKDGYFFVPEHPSGSIETPDGPVEHDAFRYRDPLGKVKRQAARFHIYAFDSDDIPLGEVTDAHADITWSARLANKKGAWFGFFGATGARSAFRGEAPPRQVNGDRLQLRNPDVGALNRVDGGPHGHHYVADEVRASALEITGQMRSVTGPGRRNSDDSDDASAHLDFVGTFKHGTEVYLGELATDAAGRLIVLGGRGVSEPVDEHGKPLLAPEDKWIVHYANNNDWHDDISDGPITATVRLKVANAEAHGVEVRGGAWVIVAPPDFAPDVNNLVSLYDVMEEVAIEAPALVNPTTPRPRDPNNPDLDNDIWTIVERSAGYRWVSQVGLRGHGQGKPGDALSALPETLDDFRTSLQKGGVQLRDHFVAMIRPPTYESPAGHRPTEEAMAIAQARANATYMPPLAGDEGDCQTGDIGTWLTVTYAQHQRLQAWRVGDLLLGPTVAGPDTFLKDGSVHPSVLTRTVLQRCAGGAFYPGIEATAITRDPKLYAEAFRFDHDVLQAGDVTKYMACPWQADFYECRHWWWPAQRPDDVVLEDAFKEIFSEFSAEETGDLAGSFERTLMNRASWDRSVGEASPRPSDAFLVNLLFPFSKEQQEQESADDYVEHMSNKWASLLVKNAAAHGSPWRQQYLIQEFLDTYSGRYYHLRAVDPAKVLTLSKLRSKYPKLVDRYQIKTPEDLQSCWRDADRDRDEDISVALEGILDLYAHAISTSLVDQISGMLKHHPSYPNNAGTAGSAAPLHAILTDIENETVDKIDQAHPGEVRLNSPIYRRYCSVELRDAMRDLAYLDNTGRNGDNGMVQDWRRLGFVVKRIAQLDNGKSLSIQIETERGKYDRANPRDQFYALLNIQDFADFPPESINIVNAGLDYAQSVIDSTTIVDPLHPESKIIYDDVGFRAKLDEIYEILRARGRNYDIYYALRSSSRETSLRGILDRSPFNQCDGAWLRHIAEAGPGDEVRSLLFEVWSDEIGNGDPALHHGNLYTTLLESLGMRLPAITTRAYASYSDIPTESYINPVFQLAISFNSDRFYPELLGMTLFLEWEVLSLQTGVMLNDYLGIDTQFWRMHVGIDNATNGHGAKARDAVILYLDKARQEGGEAAVQTHWARIWRGFVAFDVIGSNMYGNDTDIARRRPGNAAASISEIMDRKQRYGSQNHLDIRIGPHRINDLFEDSGLFQSVLANSRWIVPGDPDKSQFIDYLTTFAGPMYKIFDPKDLAAWRTWIEWLGREGDTPVLKRYSDKAQAMEKLIQELRSVAEAVASHQRYKLTSDVAHRRMAVAELFAAGDAPALMRALRDPDNGWIVPGSPADSPLIADIARGGRPMGDALDKRYPSINNRIGRQILIEWVRAGCPMPEDPLPGPDEVAKPLKSLGPKLLLHTLGPGAVH
jgi:L-Lysine epsilon oxidase N-terminal/L-lysine epsilon oxidase C-terminal domain/Iron-containing redox enzyme